jgi:hypothetical protein
MNPSRILLTALLIAAGAGCSENETKPEKPAVTVAPTATALAPVKPATMEAKKLVVDSAGSKVDFLMEAPKEKIHGRVAGATTGDISVDFMDLTKTTGLVTVDISGMELFQTTTGADGKPGEETKVDKQNEHARNWLEISKDTPEDARKKNAIVQFSIRSVEVTGEKDLSKMKGAERKVMLKATGDFLLHGHKSEKTAELEASFAFQGDKPVSVTVKSVKPFTVDLAEHDVKPRDTLGKLLLKGLDKLKDKVGKEAMVTLEYTARVDAGGAAGPAKAPTP